MDTKYCGAGKHHVSVTNFHKKGASLQPNCRDCQNALNRARYAANSETHKVHVRRNKKERIQRFNEWKRTLACSICNENFTKCLDFHHLDANMKDFQISDVVGDASVERMKEELSKCAVLCKNCHVKVHEGEITSPLSPLLKEQITIC